MKTELLYTIADGDQLFSAPELALQDWIACLSEAELEELGEVIVVEHSRVIAEEDVLMSLQARIENAIEEGIEEYILPQLGIDEHISGKIRELIKAVKTNWIDQERSPTGRTFTYPVSKDA